jgi:HlyD family secretion protein
MKPPNGTDTRDIAATLGIDASAARKRLRRLWIVAPATLLLAALAALFLYLRPTAEGVQYVTQEVRRGDLTVTVTATGSLAPTNEVEVGSELSGIVKTVEVDFNDHVRVGQPLANLDPTKFEAEVLRSRAALESAQAKVLEAQATVREADLNLERLRRLAVLNARAVSPLDVDAAEASLARARAGEASAKAQVAEARATLKVDETNLTKTVIVSPVEGLVLTRSVDPGQTVAASLQAPVLFTLAEDLTQMELQVDVDEADVGRVQDGQAAAFSVDAYPDREFAARITQVRYGSATTEGVVTYKTILKVDNPDLALRPGMTATADITVDRVAHGLLVPNAALRFSPTSAGTPSAGTRRRGLLGMLLPRPPHSRERPAAAAGSKGKTQQVWVLRDGQPQAVTVATGLSDGAWTAVTEGDLQPGTLLVVDTASVRP